MKEEPVDEGEAAGEEEEEGEEEETKRKVDTVSYQHQPTVKVESSVVAGDVSSSQVTLEIPYYYIQYNSRVYYLQLELLSSDQSSEVIKFYLLEFIKYHIVCR